MNTRQRISHHAKAVVYHNEKVLGRWKLIPNATDVFKYGWTIRWNLVTVVSGGIEVLLPILDQQFIIPRGIFGAVSVTTTVISTVARFLVQPKLSQPPITPLPKALEPYADKSDPVLPQG